MVLTVPMHRSATSSRRSKRSGRSSKTSWPRTRRTPTSSRTSRARATTRLTGLQTMMAVKERESGGDGKNNERDWNRRETTTCLTSMIPKLSGRAPLHDYKMQQVATNHHTITHIDTLLGLTLFLHMSPNPYPIPNEQTRRRESIVTRQDSAVPPTIFRGPQLGRARIRPVPSRPAVPQGYRIPSKTLQ